VAATINQCLRSTRDQITALYEKPFMDLIFDAHQIHRQHFDPNEIQLSKLLSIKTGGCPEDCAYCPQSAHYKVGIEKEKFLSVAQVVANAKVAKEEGVSRFCMGAAWRKLHQRDFERILAMVKAVKAIGLETCMTLGMLTLEQAQQLQEAGLDYYNHNLDTSPEYYKKIITTRTYEDRLQTLANVREAGLNVCCGGIIGMAESRQDRVGLLFQLCNLPTYPESVPINLLNRAQGTPLADAPVLDELEFIRTVAIARILMPTARVRLSAGRTQMSDSMQALCFFSGANSIFTGGKLFVTDNPGDGKDQQLFSRLGLSGLQQSSVAAMSSHSQQNDPTVLQHSE